MIEPKYDSISHGAANRPGQIWVRVGGLWGAVDQAGKLIVRPHFTQPGNHLCDDGWAIGFVSGEHRAVRSEDRPLTTPAGELYYAANCEEPLRIKMGDKFGYVERDLKPITDVKFEAASDFFASIAVVKLDGKFGYIRRDGSWLIEPRFEQARPFGTQQFAPVKLNRKFGCIRRNGTWAIEPHFNESPYSCDLLIAKIDGKFAHAKPDGTWHVNPRLENVGSFGRFSVAKIDGKYGIFDEVGAWLIEPRWRSFGMAVDSGLVAAKIDDKWGFIDATGALIIEDKYDEFTYFQRGIAWVKGGGVWCAIDRRGRPISFLSCATNNPVPMPGTIFIPARP